MTDGPWPNLERKAALIIKQCAEFAHEGKVDALELLHGEFSSFIMNEHHAQVTNSSRLFPQIRE